MIKLCQVRERSVKSQIEYKSRTQNLNYYYLRLFTSSLQLQPAEIQMASKNLKNISHYIEGLLIDIDY